MNSLESFRISKYHRYRFKSSRWWEIGLQQPFLCTFEYFAKFKEREIPPKMLQYKLSSWKYGTEKKNIQTKNPRLFPHPQNATLSQQRFTVSPNVFHLFHPHRSHLQQVASKITGSVRGDVTCCPFYSRMSQTC